MKKNVSNNMFSLQYGFTLVEVIFVVVIIGIVSAIGARFVVSSLESYKQAQTRNTLVQRGRLTLEQMAREIRMSIPNSHRVSPTNQCIEFLPIAAVTRYTESLTTDDNLASAKSFIDTMPFSLVRGVANYIVVGAHSPAEIYTNSNPGVRVGVNSLANDPITRIIFTQNFQFMRTSPVNRLYVADEPIRFCVQNGVLLRIHQYTLNVNPLTDTLPTGTIDIMSHDVQANGAAFSLSPGSQDRNALVNINLTFRGDATSLNLQQQVLIRNAP